MMNQLLQNKIIEYIQRLWIKHNSKFELDGIWIGLHEPISLEDNNEPDTPVTRAWFIKNDSMEEKKPIDYKVFMEFGLEAKKTYPIAYSNAALINDTDLIYIGYQFGGLYGRGMIFEINNDGELEMERVLWVS